MKLFFSPMVSIIIFHLANFVLLQSSTECFLLHFLVSVSVLLCFKDKYLKCFILNSDRRKIKLCGAFKVPHYVTFKLFITKVTYDT